MKDSLGREPRWNADRCAPLRAEARPWPLPRQILHCVCRRFASDIFLSFFPFVIRAKRCFPNASTGIGPQPLRMEHRIKSVTTIDVTDAPSPRAPRCAARTVRHCKRSEAIQSLRYRSGLPPRFATPNNESSVHRRKSSRGFHALRASFFPE
jgi:hypothetical protein